MDLGYTALMYDQTELETAFGDVAACRYDGIEFAMSKLRYVGSDAVEEWLEAYDLDLVSIMGDWLESEEAVDDLVEGTHIAADLGADFVSVLPPRRDLVDDETFDAWMGRVCKAAAEAGVTPVLHHHCASHVEQTDEIRKWLDRGPDNLRLHYDCAHYYAYGDEVEAIERFADDIAYVHFKDIAPSSTFEDHAKALTGGSRNITHLVGFINAFTDLYDGEIDFEAVCRNLDKVGYDGPITIEIENRRELPLVHAKRNYDYLTQLV